MVTKPDPPDDDAALTVKMEEIARKVLAESKNPADEKDDKDDKSNGEEKNAKTGRKTLRDEEDEWEDRVRRAIGKIDHEKEHQRLAAGESKEKKDDKEENEKPPKTARRITRILWGES